ncbi:MAG: zinc-binding dehydrogenase [Actinophytocola sp.]|nr:zinc-binding dehydrogenase [Actinophytocola sp.]
MPRFPRPGRTCAEYVTAPSRHVARKPRNLGHGHAAALPRVGLTAWQALVDAADVRAGQLVLVEPDHHDLEQLTELVERGLLRVEVDRVLPLEQAAEAHRLGESGRTRGKIVLSVGGRERASEQRGSEDGG